MLTESEEIKRDVLCLCLVTQLCPTLCEPMDCSPPGSSIHGNSLGKNTGVGCHGLLQGIFPTQELNWDLLHCRQILYQLSYQCFSCSSAGKESTCHAGDPGSIPGWGRSPGGGHGNPLQYPCLDNSMDRRVRWAPVHRVAQSQT